MFCYACTLTTAPYCREQVTQFDCYNTLDRAETQAWDKGKLLNTETAACARHITTWKCQHLYSYICVCFFSFKLIKFSLLLILLNSTSTSFSSYFYLLQFLFFKSLLEIYILFAWSILKMKKKNSIELYTFIQSNRIIQVKNFKSLWRGYIKTYDILILYSRYTQVLFLWLLWWN